MFSNDTAYRTIQNVMNVSRARERNILASESKRKKKKRKENKRKNSDSTLDNVNFETPSQVSSMGSKGGSSPRSMAGLNKTDNHIKDSGNPKLLRWLKEKDKEHRKKAKEERRQKREEREKTVLEANEKFEKRLEAQKIYKKWVDEKNKEIAKQEKQKRKEVKQFLKAQEEKEKSTEISIRPKSAPLNRRDPAGGIRVEGNSSTNVNVKTTPHPPASKFIYKRPVAGRIKLKISDKEPEKARPQSAHAGNVSNGEDTARRQRMSYDDWISRKRRDDQKKKNLIERRKREEMSKSDPELSKIIPNIAKKRIHNILEGKKRVDSGFKEYDKEANEKFGGADFNGTSETESQEVRYSYRLDSPTRSSSSMGSNSARRGKPPPAARPKTAPHGGSRVIPPKQSSGSPRKAVVPARVEEIMSNEDSTNPFRLPFSEEDGIPKYVAAKQRQLFAENVWKKVGEEERPEPQGSDVQEPHTCVSTDVNNHSAESQSDAKSRTNVENGDLKDEGDVKNVDTDKSEEGKVFLTQFNSVDNLTNIVQNDRKSEKVETSSRAKEEEVKSESKTGKNDKTEVENSKMSEEAQVYEKMHDEDDEEVIRNDEKCDTNKDVVHDREKEVNAKQSDENGGGKDNVAQPETVKNEMKYEELISEVHEMEGKLDMKYEEEEVYKMQENIEMKFVEENTHIIQEQRKEYDEEKICEQQEFKTEELHVLQHEKLPDLDMERDAEVLEEPRPESVATTRSNKHVSFREEPEVFRPEQDELEGSTDTQTPENEEEFVKFFESDIDVSASLDGLNKSGNVNASLGNADESEDEIESEVADVTTSLDDDF